MSLQSGEIGAPLRAVNPMWLKEQNTISVNELHPFSEIASATHA